jgi:glycopeptide antibiotics resistance protein
LFDAIRIGRSSPKQGLKEEMHENAAKTLSRAYLVLAVTFTALAVYGSFVPFRFAAMPVTEAVGRFFRGLSHWSAPASRSDLAVNFMLFIPISFFWLQVAGGQAKTSRDKAIAVFLTLVACTAVSLAIELTQNWFPPRVPSLRDVVAQMGGTAVGCAIWLAAGRTVSDWLQAYLAQPRPARQINWLLQIYVIGLLLYSIMPLDLTISPAELHHKYEDEGKVVLMPFSHDYGSALQTVYVLASDVAIFLPVGMWAVTAFVPAGCRRSLSSSFLLGFAVVAGVEFCQLFVLSRFTDTTDLITGAVGVLIGAHLMRRWSARLTEPSVKRPRLGTAPVIAWEWLAVAAIYAACMIVVYWAPFDFTSNKELIKQRMGHFFSLPFSAALRGHPFVAITAITRKVVLFLPLGVFFALAARPLPTRFRRLLLAVLLLLSWGVTLIIELGQIPLLEHSPAFDDTFIYTAGTALGVWITSRILHVRQVH